MKLAAGDGFAPSRPPSKGGVLLVRRPGNEMVEPEVVATSPNRIKSPVPVYCGFSSLKMVRAKPKLDERRLVLAAGFAPALATLSTSCLFCWTTRAEKLDPPAGIAPAESLYKNDAQAAAWRQKLNSARFKREPLKGRARASQSTDGCDVASRW